MVMIKANILAVKTKLSEFVERAAAGELVVICRHNTPVAELRAVAAARADPRPVGPLPGRPTFEIPASFFEPMTAAELASWDEVPADDPLSPAWTPDPTRATAAAVPARRRAGAPSGRRATGTRR